MLLSHNNACGGSYFINFMTNKFLVTMFLLATLFVFIATPVVASGSAFDFGSCINPQVTASQVNKGDRFGIVGTTKLYSGTDAIYNLSNGNVLQCLCQKNGKGIQTNWLRVGKMAKNDIEKYKNSGWTYIITGSTWGLKDEPYLAKNIEYTCKGNKKTEVKGLASTGNEVALYGLVIAGVFSLAAGLLLKRVSK